MRADQWKRFVALRDSFKNHCARWAAALPGLGEAQAEMLISLGQDPYPIETPVVYNRALDELGPEADIAWIVVADNPGRREQEACSQRYLVGLSGKAAENFFRRELNLDFRSQAIVINKTPVHSAKTVQLKKLLSLYPGLLPTLRESQTFMATLVPQLQKALGARVWVMGLSELGPRGLFKTWTESLLDAYKDEAELFRNLYLFNHFSMGSFATDLKKRRRPGEETSRAVLRIGAENRARVLG